MTRALLGLLIGVVACGGDITGSDSGTHDGASVEAGAADEGAGSDLTGLACLTPDGGSMVSGPSCDATSGADPSPQCADWWSSVGNTDLNAVCNAPKCELVIAQVLCDFGPAGDDSCAQHYQRALGISGEAYGKCATSDGKADVKGQCESGDHCGFDSVTGLFGCSCGNIPSASGQFVCGRRVPNGPLEWLPICVP